MKKITPPHARNAMNTIPTIFNEKITPYTVIGGKERAVSSKISAVVLNRRGHYERRDFFQELEKKGFDNVISIESSKTRYDVEELSARFPFARFIMSENQINTGQQINLAASETDSPLFLVLWNDMKIISGGCAQIMAERLINENVFKRLCTVPILINSRFDTLPCMTTPVTQKKKLLTITNEPRHEGHLSLFPFQGVGIYDRLRFIQMGGYDPDLNNFHWQLMDFGMRSWLWGEETALSIQLKFSCEDELPVEDSTIENSYRRFYLKNLAPVLKNDYAKLPYYLFPAFKIKSGIDFFTGLEEFRQCREWVKKNKYRWRRDAKGVVDLWD
ncbi:MAG: hypothetical protein LBB81_08985 [Treponema sp.]|nr:hypothetical protein [Treponema sp.]